MIFQKDALEPTWPNVVLIILISSLYMLIMVSVSLQYGVFCCNFTLNLASD